jgi:hypothetical protein
MRLALTGYTVASLRNCNFRRETPIQRTRCYSIFKGLPLFPPSPPPPPHINNVFRLDLYYYLKFGHQIDPGRFLWFVNEKPALYFNYYPLAFSCTGILIYTGRLVGCLLGIWLIYLEFRFPSHVMSFYAELNWLIYSISFLRSTNYYLPIPSVRSLVTTVLFRRTFVLTSSDAAELKMPTSSFWWYDLLCLKYILVFGSIHRKILGCCLEFITVVWGLFWVLGSVIMTSRSGQTTETSNGRSCTKLPSVLCCFLL